MLFRYRNIICSRTKKFDRQISTFWHTISYSWQYSVSAKKYHFSEVTQLSLFSYFYLPKNITIFKGRYRYAKSNLRPLKIIFSLLLFISLDNLAFYIL